MSDEIRDMLLDYANDTVELEEIAAGALNYHESHSLIGIWIRSLTEFLKKTNISEEDMNDIKDSFAQMMMSNHFLSDELPRIRLYLKMMSRQQIDYLDIDKQNNIDSIRIGNFIPSIDSLLKEMSGVENLQRKFQVEPLLITKSNVEKIINSYISQIEEEKNLEEEERKSALGYLNKMKNLYQEIKTISPELGPKLIIDAIQNIFS